MAVKLCVIIYYKINLKGGTDLGLFRFGSPDRKGKDVKMKKIVEITGMTCAHCQSRAEQALNAVNGVEAKVDLKKNRAIVNLNEGVSDQSLIDALKEVEFEVVSIKEKKGLFS